LYQNHNTNFTLS